MIGLLVTLILFPLVGWSLGRRSWGEAFLFGVGITGTLLFFAGLVHVPLVAALLLIGAWGIGSLAWTISRRGTGLPGSQVAGLPNHLQAEARQPGNRAAGQLFPTILLSLPLIALIFVTVITPLSDFDGRAFWVLKAKGIAHERAIDGPFFRGATLDPRNHYPILIPLDGAVILGITHDLDDRQIRWLYLGLLIALALLVRERIGRLISPAAGAWCAALLVWIPQFVVEGEGGALSAYNDIAIAAFAAGAFFELVAAESPSRLGLWLVFLLLTKSEGLPFALVFLIIGAFVFRKRIAIPAIATVVATIALFVWRARIPVGDEEDILRMLPTLFEKLHNLGHALTAFPRHMLLLPRWGIFWIAVVIAAVLALRVERRTAMLAIGVIVAMLAVYAGVYVTTDWVVSDLIAVTADRLLMHVIAPALMLIALAFQRTKSM
jgi:hypothetical protein